MPRMVFRMVGVGEETEERAAVEERDEEDAAGRLFALMDTPAWNRTLIRSAYVHTQISPARVTDTTPRHMSTAGITRLSEVTIVLT